MQCGHHRADLVEQTPYMMHIAKYRADLSAVNKRKSPLAVNTADSSIQNGNQEVLLNRRSEPNKGSRLLNGSNKKGLFRILGIEVQILQVFDSYPSEPTVISGFTKD